MILQIQITVISKSRFDFIRETMTIRVLDSYQNLRLREWVRTIVGPVAG